MCSKITELLDDEVPVIVEDSWIGSLMRRYDDRGTHMRAQQLQGERRARLHIAPSLVIERGKNDRPISRKLTPDGLAPVALRMMQRALADAAFSY